MELPFNWEFLQKIRNRGKPKENLRSKQSLNVLNGPYEVSINEIARDNDAETQSCDSLEGSVTSFEAGTPSFNSSFSFEANTVQLPINDQEGMIEYEKLQLIETINDFQTRFN